MADKYHRLVSFMVNICPEPLRELFLTQAKAEQGTTYTTLDSYLHIKRPKITKLVQKKKLRQDQFNLLFPSPGTAPDIAKWDISLLSLLITDFFGSTLQKSITFFMGEIRDVRNILQHTSSTSMMSDTTFDDTWKRLEIASLFIANLHGAAYENDIKQKVNVARVSNMPELGNTLCLWFEEKFSQFQSNVTEISENTKDIQANASESAFILRSASIKKPGPDGAKVAKLRTVDKKLKRMQESFERTMKTEIPDKFEPPPETDRVKAMLRDKRFVIVAGQSNSLYPATALSAIQGMGYNDKRCCEMQSSSDWNHVDPDDVDFVLYCHPFGKDLYSEEKGKSMADIFSSIQHTVNEASAGKKIAVLMLSDIGVLNECKDRHYHEILEEVMTVYPPTSQNDPADLTLARCSNNVSCSNSTVSQNLKELTALFLAHHKMKVHPEILIAAKSELKAHKSVLIVGLPKKGKTSLAVALASSYHPSQVLLLTYPDQIQHIDFNTTHLVIIDDFAGKYTFDHVQTCSWYKTFDLLHVMLSAGKLNIIITCEKPKLDKCLDEIGKHHLLDHTVELSDQTFLVKEETNSRSSVDLSLPVPVGLSSILVESRSLQRVSPTKLTAPRFASAMECIELSHLFDEYQLRSVDFTCICLTKDGSIYVVVTCGDDTFLIYHNKDINNTIKYPLNYKVWQMCCTNAGDIVVVPHQFFPTREQCLFVLRTVDVSVMVIKAKQVEGHCLCSAVSCDENDQIYTLWRDGSINVYNIKLQIIDKFKFNASGGSYPSSCVISPRGHSFKYSYIEMKYENFRSKLMHKNKNISKFYSCMCVASEEPYTVFVLDSSHNIVHYNTNLETISKIPIPDCNLKITRMVFDESSSRLVVCDKSSGKVYEMYLQ